MRRTFFIALGLVAALLVVLTSGAIAAEPTPNEDGNTSTVIAQLGPRLQVLDWEYGAGEFRVLLEADVPEQIVVSDALGPVSNRGVEEVPQKRVMVNGRQWVAMDVGSYRGAAAISVASSSGAIYLSTGITIGNPWSGGSPTVGWIGGALVAILMFVAAGYWTLRREDDSPIVAGGGST